MIGYFFDWIAGRDKLQRTIIKLEAQVVFKSLEIRDAKLDVLKWVTLYAEELTKDKNLRDIYLEDFQRLQDAFDEPAMLSHIMPAIDMGGSFAWRDALNDDPYLILWLHDNGYYEPKTKEL